MLRGSGLQGSLLHHHVLQPAESLRGTDIGSGSLAQLTALAQEQQRTSSSSDELTGSAASSGLRFVLARAVATVGRSSSAMCTGRPSAAALKSLKGGDLHVLSSLRPQA